MAWEKRRSGVNHSKAHKNVGEQTKGELWRNRQSRRSRTIKKEEVKNVSGATGQGKRSFANVISTGEGEERKLSRA